VMRVFWPTRISSWNQSSIRSARAPLPSAITASVAGKFFLTGSRVSGACA
jgi:hypothetical protein